MGNTSSTPASILVVDDNEANRALARSTLEDEGYRVVVASGGQEAIAAFEREPADCVLLDVRMPDLDGFAVCQRIRALPGGAEARVLFVTALREVDTFDHALRAGGDDFLTKPVRPTELIVRVQTALQFRRMSAELREHFALLKKQRDDLIRLQLQKERLMAFVVHDLKNPVNSMDLNAQILVRNRDLPEEARAAATRIRSEARQLGRLILNLLDLSKADEGKLAPKPTKVDAAALVAAVLNELDVAAQARRVTLRSAVDVEFIHADEDLLRRTLANLVENAVRHSPAGGIVTVAVSGGGDGVKARVSDSGQGVPVDLRERIFDPFLQVESGDRTVNSGGRGLGLAFCRLAVEAHGGRIWVEDAAPGAIFCLWIPHGQTLASK